MGMDSPVEEDALRTMAQLMTWC